MRSHREFTKPLASTIGVPPQIHKTLRMHHWDPTADSQNPKGAPLGSDHELTKPKGAPLGSDCEFTKPQVCSIGVPPRIHKSPRVHHWGPTANSQNCKGAPLGSDCEFTKPYRGAPLGSDCEFKKPQRCTTGVPLRISKSPRLYHWGPIKNLQNPKGAPLGSHCEYTKPQGCTIGVPPRIHKTPRVHYLVLLRIH